MTEPKPGFDPSLSSESTFLRDQDPSTAERISGAVEVVELYQSMFVNDCNRQSVATNARRINAATSAITQSLISQGVDLTRHSDSQLDLHLGLSQRRVGQLNEGDALIRKNEDLELKAQLTFATKVLCVEASIKPDLKSETDSRDVINIPGEEQRALFNRTYIPFYNNFAGSGTPAFRRNRILVLEENEELIKALPERYESSSKKKDEEISIEEMLQKAASCLEITLLAFAAEINSSFYKDRYEEAKRAGISLEDLGLTSSGGPKKVPTNLYEELRACESDERMELAEKNCREAAKFYANLIQEDLIPKELQVCIQSLVKDRPTEEFEEIFWTSVRDLYSLPQSSEKERTIWLSELRKRILKPVKKPTRRIGQTALI